MSQATEDIGLRVRGLAMGYGARDVLQQVTLPLLAPGSVTALIGPNAAGKSTLLRGIAGLQAARGDVLLDGHDLGRQPLAERARRMVYLPQSLPARSRLAVFEAVLSAVMAGREGLGLMGRRADAEDMAKVDAVLARLGLGALADRSVEALSGGQRQLVGLAQALVRRPRVLLLDEPTSALDLYHQFQVIDTVCRETRERGLVTLVVLHDINLALGCADRVLVLHDGALAGEGPPHQVIDSSLLARVYRVRGALEQVRGRPMVVVEGALHDNNTKETPA